jgi:hypothetical protein
MAECKPMRHRNSAPSDAACRQAWTEIMRIAEAHALITWAGGGVANLCMPDVQRSQPGLREQTLAAHCMNESTQ